jgi:hypothetical protein
MRRCSPRVMRSASTQSLLSLILVLALRTIMKSAMGVALLQ